MHTEASDRAWCRRRHALATPVYNHGMPGGVLHGFADFAASDAATKEEQR